MAGTLDKSFGKNGYTISNFREKNIANAQVIDSNNCTIVTGETDNSLYLAKYTSTGILDTTFGFGKGYVIGEYYTEKSSEGSALLLDISGNIFVTGFGVDSNDFRRLLLAKYKSNGQLDISFGGGKGWIVDIIGNSNNTLGTSIALDSNGKIVITGGAYDERGSSRPFVARYNVDGSLDTTFGENSTGYNVVTTTGGSISGRSIIIDDNTGKITISSVNSVVIEFTYIIRFTDSGLLDTSFGKGIGYIDITDIIQDGTDLGKNMILDKNNNLLITGAFFTDLDFNLNLARFKNDGRLDTTFGENGGYTITSIPNYLLSTGISLVIDSSNRIIVLGIVAPSLEYKSANTLLVRYSGDGKLDKTFGGNGLGYSINSFGYNYSLGTSLALDINGLVVVSGDVGELLGTSSALIARFYNENNEPICLVAGTPILTDQGLVAIEQIDPTVHTIAHKRIVAITTTISPEKNLICFEANSMGINCPSQRTLMTPGHEVFYKGKLVQAKHFLGRVDGVHTVPYNGKDILYNVLQEQHGLMRVNNMVLETLHPDNKVAKAILMNTNY
jgi:uncharacterized delta-60 repeat protein